MMTRFILIFCEKWLKSFYKSPAKISGEMEIIVKGYIPEAQNVLCGKLFETGKDPMMALSFELVENDPAKLAEVGRRVKEIAGKDKVKVVILNVNALRFNAFEAVRTCTFVLPKQDLETAEQGITKKLEDVRSKQGLSFSFLLLEEGSDLKALAFNKKVSGVNLYSWQRYFGDLCRFWKGTNLVSLWSFAQEM